MLTRNMRPVFSGFIILVVASAIEATLSDRYLNGTRRFPEIKPGQKCVKGQIYRMDCNTCHCGERNTLLCTKMGCLLKTDGRRAEQTGCIPGKLYKKDCQKCFCTDKGKVKCSMKDCKLADKPYINPEHIKPHTAAEFYRLPPLPHTGTACRPGVTYRIDCNTCFCLESANLMCQHLLCPSYDDVYKLKAKEMTGKPCEANSTTSDCLECECKAGKYKCEPKPNCRHTDGRRQLHGEYPSKHDRNFIDPDRMKEKCEPGMVYKVHCNKCYCQDDGSLRCTQKTCLNHAEVEKLKKLRLKLDKEDPE
ncbi:pacifastin-like protease inhibitor cvp4 [Cydia fagiglandana]|uniref:pacifastin-like protease inhibitor cvp4 n=1 Tax=Cydia fagiglandana TaxID=1458189 RepID=UPI002FEE4844